MNCLRSLLLYISILLSTLLYGQQDLSISVKKPCSGTRQFTYQGNPVSPLAILNLFSMEENTVDSVSLPLYPFNSQTVHDTSSSPRLCSCGQSYSGKLSFQRGTYNEVIDSTQENINGSFVAYCVRQNTSGNKFIVEFWYNGGGNLTFQSLFVLDIRGDYLINLAEFQKDYDTKYNSFVINGNTIQLGRKTFFIPASAR